MKTKIQRREKRCRNSKTSNRLLTFWRTTTKSRMKMFCLMPLERLHKLMPLLNWIQRLLTVLLWMPLRKQLLKKLQKRLLPKKQLLKKQQLKKQSLKKQLRKLRWENLPRQLPFKQPLSKQLLKILHIRLLSKIPLFKKPLRKPLMKKQSKKLPLCWPLGKTFQTRKKNAHLWRSPVFLELIEIPHHSLKSVRIIS